MKFIKHTLLCLPLIAVMAGCQSDEEQRVATQPVYIPISTEGGTHDVILTPNAIPGTPRSENLASTGGYAPTHVQTQFKVDINDKVKEVNVIRDNADPYVFTKPYVLKYADPYAVRGYLQAAVGAKSVDDSPARVSAVKFNDGTGVVLVSAEEYRFKDSDKGKGIDSIVASLDRKGLSYMSNSDAYIYFPKCSRAANLRDMLDKIGSAAQDAQFEESPTAIVTDAELNALIIRAPRWKWLDIRRLLLMYDRPIPQVKLTFRILEIYAENDDRIGVDFQSWKNNDGVDLFSAGMVARRNWGTFFTSGVESTGFNKTSYWNFNPKWNTRYLDFMTSIGKAKCLTQGVITVQNRMLSTINISTGYFYDRTYYDSNATTLSDAFNEYAYTNPNPDTIEREAISKIVPISTLNSFYNEASGKAGVQAPVLQAMGYTKRVFGTQTTTNVYGDVSAYAGLANSPNALAKYLTGYVKKDKDGTPVQARYYNTDWDTVNSAPGIIHGWVQYPMIADGFTCNIRIIPVVTGNASTLKFEMENISLLGWNSDGSARSSSSSTNTTVQIGYGANDFVIGGLKKSESVRSTTGLPYLKDMPVIGRAVSTESESIKQSQLVLIARAEYSEPDEVMATDIRDNLGKVIKSVNKGMTSRVGNMFFDQYYLDDEREERKKRLDNIGNTINDDYKGYK